MLAVSCLDSAVAQHFRAGGVNRNVTVNRAVGVNRNVIVNRNVTVVGRPVVGRSYHGGIWYGTGPRFWKGRSYAYGVGPCWAASPIGFVWICG
jgi:hypothetical protein